METVVLPDNGFGGPPAGMHHWQILNTTERSMGGQKKEGVADGRERQKTKKGWGG